MKKKKSHIRLRAFCSAFMLTCCLLLLGTGFLIADYNTRRMSFGDDELRIGGVFLDMLPEPTTPCSCGQGGCGPQFRRDGAPFSG